METVSKSTEDTKEIARQFLACLSSHNEKATVVGLKGDLGSGKTTFTTYVGELCGVLEVMTSPTFVIQKRYRTSHPFFRHLVHIDAYRLESGDELLDLEWKRLLKDPHTLIIIEWPEKVEEVLPKEVIYITFEHYDENTRKINVVYKEEV